LERGAAEVGIGGVGSDERGAVESGPSKRPWAIDLQMTACPEIVAPAKSAVAMFRPRRSTRLLPEMVAPANDVWALVTTLRWLEASSWEVV